MLLRRLILIKSSRAISRVRWLKITDISGTISVRHHRGYGVIMALMMGTEMVPETSVMFNQLTWMIVRENVVNLFMGFL
jgi:hypothetical protein